MPDRDAASAAKPIPVRRWFALAIAVILADQASKWLATDVLCCRAPIAVMPYFNLVLAHNTGAAFSFLATEPGWQRWFFAGIAFIAGIVISVLLVRHARDPAQRRFCAGLALILGGALGNLVDRVLYGYVVDFLDFYVGAWHWPAFNVADSAISIGAALLVLDSFRRDAVAKPAG